MNQRVLLNSSLVTQTNLTHLEVEFTKREIAAITFQAGVALKDFKRALALLTTRPMVIAERGGIKKFLAGNLIEGVRITPAAKPKEEGDMIDVGMDIESYLTAQAILGPEGSSGSSMALDMLMDAAGAKRPQGFGGSPRELVAVADDSHSQHGGGSGWQPLGVADCRDADAFRVEARFPARLFASGKTGRSPAATPRGSCRRT